MAAWPTATQSLVEPHETVLRNDTPEGTGSAFQVVPPLAVVRIASESLPAPTITQSLVEAHETDTTPPNPAGKVALYQDAPAVVVTSTTASKLVLSPSATQ